MSKNSSISEGNRSRPFTAKRLKTNLDGGDTCIWVPEDERRLKTKHITENGVYVATDDDCYGYSQVIISISSNSIRGKDPNTGETISVSVDPSTGDLIETQVPVEIRVIEPPTNPYGIYLDGQTIKKDGMIVKAYFATGDEYGTVPNGEITINPTIATYDPSTVRSGGTATIDDTSA